MKAQLKWIGYFILGFLGVCTFPVWIIIWIITRFHILNWSVDNAHKAYNIFSPK